MNDTGLGHILWIILAICNFTVQLLYFFYDRRPGLYAAKKVTTPLLLFGGLAIVLFNTGSFSLIPGAILLVMGLGELGIEGSRVVEKGDLNKGAESKLSWMVTAAGVLFLLVNLFLGITLLIRAGNRQSLYFGIFVGFAVVALMVYSIVRHCRPSAEIRFQLIVYSGGLAVLAAGALSNLSGGLGVLGRAALVLTVSDSLVLIRMGAAWKKEGPGERGLLLIFLITILLLYYLFIALLIGMAVPFQ